MFASMWHVSSMARTFILYRIVYLYTFFFCHTLRRKHSSDLLCHFLNSSKEFKAYWQRSALRNTYFKSEIASFASGWHCEIKMRGAVERKSKQLSKKRQERRITVGNQMLLTCLQDLWVSSIYLLLPFHTFQVTYCIVKLQCIAIKK